MIEIVDDEGRILGLLDERCAMPVQRRHGESFRVWLRRPLPRVAPFDPAGMTTVEEIAAYEVVFRWYGHRRRGPDEYGEPTYITRWYLKLASPITDEQWKMDPSTLSRMTWK